MPIKCSLLVALMFLYILHVLTNNNETSLIPLIELSFLSVGEH